MTSRSSGPVSTAASHLRQGAYRWHCQIEYVERIFRVSGSEDEIRFIWDSGHEIADEMPKSPLSDITLDNVITGGTCDPISLADFETYLEYKEYSLENLQFVVWFQDYRGRFFDLPQETQALSPGDAEFKFSLPCPAKTAQRIASSKRNYARFISLPSISETGDPDTVLPSSQAVSPLLPYASTPSFPPNPESQPFRDECQAVVATFLRPGAYKELTLDSNIRDSIIRNMTWNTHPDVFLPAYEEVYDSLSSVSLPHFLTLASENMNFPKKLYWYTIGIVNILLGLLIAVLLILLVPANGGSHIGGKRAWRLFAVPLSGLGGMQIYSAYKGFCTQVWGRGSTQLRSWELQEQSSFTDEDDEEKTIGVFSSSVAKIPQISSSIAPFRDDAKSPSGRAGLDIIAPFASPDEASIESTPKRRRTPVKRIPPPALNLSSLTVDVIHDEEAFVPISPSSECSSNSDNYPPKKPPRSPDRPPFPATWDQSTPKSNSATEVSTPNQRSSLESMGDAAHQYKERYPRHKDQPTAIKPKIPVFGPERVVMDPRIKKVHAKILRDMIYIGIVWTIVWTVIICSVPSP